MRRRGRRRQSGAIGAAPMPPLLPSSLLLPYSTVLQCSEAVYTEALLYVVAKQAAYPTPTNSLQDSRTAAAAMRRRAAAHSARCLRSSEHLLGGGTVPSPKYHSLGLPHGGACGGTPQGRPLVLLLPLGHSCQCQKKACLYDS